MKKATVLSLCLALFMVISSCKENATTGDSAAAIKSESAPVDMKQVRAEIQTIENAWADAMTKKDLNALMGLYADDAVSMQDGAPSLNGKAAIQAQHEKEFAAPPKYASISFQTQDVYGTTEEVTEVGISEEKDAAGKVTGTGKYMAVFQKKDGKYKCVREIYNRDQK